LVEERSSINGERSLVHTALCDPLFDEIVFREQVRAGFVRTSAILHHLFVMPREFAAPDA
jgi:hypothetical protein